MEYQQIISSLDDRKNQPSKFRTRNWIGSNDESQGKYNVNSNIKFKTLVLRSNSCDDSIAYVNVKATIIVQSTVATAAPVSNTNKNVILKTCASFTNCISEINNTQVDDARSIYLVMSAYNVTE